MPETGWSGTNASPEPSGSLKAREQPPSNWTAHAAWSGTKRRPPAIQRGWSADWPGTFPSSSPLPQGLWTFSRSLPDKQRRQVGVPAAFELIAYFASSKQSFNLIHEYLHIIETFSYVVSGEPSLVKILVQVIGDSE